MSVWQRPPVLVGESVLWLGSGSGLPKPSIVKWIGHLPGIGPDWTVGLELVITEIEFLIFFQCLR